MNALAFSYSGFFHPIDCWRMLAQLKCPPMMYGSVFGLLVLGSLQVLQFKFRKHGMNAILFSFFPCFFATRLALFAKIPRHVDPEAFL